MKKRRRSSGKDEADKDEQGAKKPRWTNKQRVLIFCARGITHRPRHLMNDLRLLLPHSKADAKLHRKDKLFVVNEVCDLKNCNKCIFLEMRKKKDCFLWLSQTPHGPSAKFLVENIHTMDEMKLTGNCLKGSRPLLSFDEKFAETPHFSLLKELFKQIFGTPCSHPKSKPFIDHVFNFAIADNRIWFRNYQIVEETGSLIEIGPRFVLNLVRIFSGSFGGVTLYENPHYMSPNEHRRILKLKVGWKQRDRLDQKVLRSKRLKETELPEGDIDTLFDRAVE
ncbi:ribosome biogenesis protein BRX1 homolog isoform X2 [Oscarella lobularis]|uniref:ribosome biogenesis protein BRX1 homolog isoform X2 n=1 Tax=Oscarella lobularis TaxID=121494 RepID=UPI0033138FB5